VPRFVRLRRIGYRVAYALLRTWWWAARPHVTGVKCVLRDAAGRVLLVRHTYGPPLWDLPGGIHRRSEQPHETARREMAEELGLDRAGWSPLGIVRGRIMHRRDTIHVFGLQLAAERPALTADPVELAQTRWCEPADLPRPLAYYASGILRELEPVTPTRSSPAACS
jgi:8-oxo-dGTP pyrophosphatase MutT (NUDIX family)